MQLVELREDYGTRIAWVVEDNLSLPDLVSSREKRPEYRSDKSAGPLNPWADGRPGLEL